MNGIYFQKLYATLGSSIDLSVNVTGYPLPKSEWTFISTTDKTNLSSFMETNTSLNITTGSYHLRKTFMKDDEFGLYTLHLTNNIGKVTTYFYVLTEVSNEGQIPHYSFKPFITRKHHKYFTLKSIFLICYIYLQNN